MGHSSPVPTGPKITTPGSTLSALVSGCKVWVDRPEEEPRRAEVLSIRTRPPAKGAEPKEEASAIEFYLHFINYNKRLDEWVPGARLFMDREVEWPAPPAAARAGSATPTRASQRSDSNVLRKTALKANAKTNKRRSNSVMDLDDEASGGKENRGIVGPTGKNAGEGGEGESELVIQDGTVIGETNDEEDEVGTFSKEQEIEKLRTHGSMTQSVHEIARVKNLDRIQMGKHEVEAWYFSPYPQEFAHIPVMYICEFCLSFFCSHKSLSRHRTKCTLYHPPGNEIYRWEDISFYEIDGRKQKTWCRNLCLLSKLFLDHKTLYYDVDPFLFYCMVVRDELGAHLIGYFSKEKESAESYNVACILTLPQHQRHGYGKLLIEFSYELSKKENRLGSPEKPLSDLGLLSYRAYWSEIIVDYLLSGATAGGDVSIDEIAQRTSFVHQDIMHTCQALQILKFVKNQYIIVLSDAVVEQHERTKRKKRRRINPDALKWKPPVFSRAQLQFGF